MSHVALTDYHRMVATGVLGEDDRVELLSGRIVPMTPINARHAAAVKQLNRLFHAAIHASQQEKGPGPQIIVSVQDPVSIPPDSELEPDVMLLKPSPDVYCERHPRPSDVLLLVEVADSSLRHDRDVKIPLYARAGIPEVWLVDVERCEVTMYCEPTPESYAQVALARDEWLTPVAVPRAAIARAGLFPRG